MNNKSFGLDIGSTAIKAVWLSSQRDGFLLNSHFIAPTPARGMSSEAPLDEEEMAEAIKTTVDNARITTKNVNIAFAEHQVYTKVIEMPALSDKELALAIYWEAEQYIPVPLSSITLVWSILEKPQKLQATTVGKMQVLVVGAPTMLINKYQKVLTMAGLNVVSIETEILSVIRALVTQKKGTVGNFPPTIVINIGASSTALAIVKNGGLIFTYYIPVGGIAISRAIEVDLGLTLQQAEEYKKAYGVSKEGQSEKISKAIESILASILSEAKKALAFYSQKYKDDAPIQQILLSGGTARLPGIDLFFAENCGIETAIANPWKILVNKELSKEMITRASDYTIAVGLAMRGYE